MKSLRVPQLISLFTGILLILGLFSCKKDAYELGIDLLPPSDTLNVKTTDTCTVIAFSVIQDSVRTSNPSSLMMGSMLDPVFGKSTCSFFSQVQLSSEGVDFGSQPVLDSLVLKLYYSSYKGDTTTRQIVKVYEMSDDIYYDSNYYSNQLKGYYPTLLADLNFTPHPNDSVLVAGTKEQAHLRINLSNMTHYLGNKILYAPTSALASNDEFIKFFKGLYVASAPVNSNGALLRFQTDDGLSKLVVYYHDGTDPNNDSLEFEMPMNESCGRFVHIDHNGYLDACQDLKRQILNHDSAQGANKIFLQGLGGVKIKVKFPYMANFGKGKVVAINDALLMIKNFETDTTYAPPPTITMIRQDSIGRFGYVIDDSEGSDYFGGTYDQAKRTYFFRITQHMQKMMANYYSSHFDLYIIVNYPLASVLNTGRIVLNGTKSTLPGAEADRFQLKVTYTILN
ncbi:MAG: DUF4270 domain-containing protein [Bacteroidales bacterium]|nr:DUF4270 domain-containing protein [Bacteroidales bacterium]